MATREPMQIKRSVPIPFWCTARSDMRRCPPAIVCVIWALRLMCALFLGYAFWRVYGRFGTGLVWMDVVSGVDLGGGGLDGQISTRRWMRSPSCRQSLRRALRCVHVHASTSAFQSRVQYVWARTEQEGAMCSSNHCMCRSRTPMPSSRSSRRVCALRTST